ncbi:MAG: cytochrome c biogenesis protein CcsA [Verrucomicrobia bacterium]|nr:cytochrome c biogenesis protein CcsA [Verrucomicrobiota bacterium]
MSGKSAVRTEDKQTLSSSEWLLEAMTRPEAADTRKIFRVQHPDLEGMFGTQKIGLEHHSFNDLTNHLGTIEEQARNIRRAEFEKKSDPQTRTPFQKDLMHLYNSVVRYHQIKNTLGPEGSRDFAREVDVFQQTIEPAVTALRQMNVGEEYDQSDIKLLAAFHKRYTNVSMYAYAMIVPPQTSEPRDGWKNIGASLMETILTHEVHPAVTNITAIYSAYAQNEPEQFNQALANYKVWLQSNNLLSEMKKGRQEFLFNRVEFFYKSIIIYVAALLLAGVYWINRSEALRKSGYLLLILAFVIQTIGLAFRMYLEDRPPVTNLYSSAIFVGWGSVFLGIILERIFRDGIGTFAAANVGFITLIIAHHLSLSGDTMEMLRAVLDTNFWLATHVVVITIGYSAMFLAGLLAIVYIFRGFFTKALAAETGKSLSRMVYGIICFAALFSFVGTILGGIWADQSWGRFWGWDPKENGALLIVIWCAIILHARWGKLVNDRQLMALAVFGNVITSFSWFGVNMLGIGLHSYGFMDAAFFWLSLFISSQMLIIAVALLPAKMWKSFGNGGQTSQPSAPPDKPTEASAV